MKTGPPDLKETKMDIYKDEGIAQPTEAALVAGTDATPVDEQGDSVTQDPQMVMTRPKQLVICQLIHRPPRARQAQSRPRRERRAKLWERL